MDWFSELFGLSTVVAADTAVEAKNEYITIENFAVQGAERNVLTYIKSATCTQDDPLIKPMYYPLYDCLTKPEVGVIVSQGFSFWLFETTYKVTEDKSKLSAAYLEKVLKEDPRVQEVAKCYAVNYNALSDMLIKYVYGAADQFKALTGGASRKKKGKKATRKMRRKKE